MKKLFWIQVEEFVHHKLKIVSSLTRPHVIPNPFEGENIHPQDFNWWFKSVLFCLEQYNSIKNDLYHLHK